MKCRHCLSDLEEVFLDLGFSPPSNSYLTAAELHRPEVYFPLRLFVCTHCWLVQTEDFTSAGELFREDYAYFSSVSSTWLAHARDFASMITNRLSLSRDSMVIEVASNDGYLLKNFVSNGIPCLGIEPTESTATAAEALGVPVRRAFFGVQCAEELRREGVSADLLIGNNVYAHVPDINDFTAGLKMVLAPTGTITLEFPHLMRLIEKVQFDTVYHEHFSYLSLGTVAGIFESAGLRVFDVEELSTHGGSLRVYGCHAGHDREESSRVATLKAREAASGLYNVETYRGFQLKAERIKDDLVSFLISQKRLGQSMGGYGAAAKGNTLLNFCGIKPDLLPYVCDAAPSKQGKFLPGSHIPIVSPAAIREKLPQNILILPWNLQKEIVEQLSFAREWGATFVVPAPELRAFKA